jgi:dipeptide/tripeptide permease
MSREAAFVRNLLRSLLNSSISSRMAFATAASLILAASVWAYIIAEKGRQKFRKLRN